MNRQLVPAFAGVVMVMLSGMAFAQRFGGTREPVRLLDKYDANGDGYLNAKERAAALVEAEKINGSAEYHFQTVAKPATPGKKLTPAQVKTYGSESLYDPQVLRTLFLQFEDKDWERELKAFKGTDVEVPATVSVDGKTYHEVGVRFRGLTSYRTVSDGQKRSLNLSINLVHKKQRLLGYRGLSLLNAAADPTFLRSVLYMQVARAYIPAPKANYLRVAINGENWGVYVNQQQFNTDFTEEAVGFKGARWKVPGSPRGRGGLLYLGDDAAPYKRIYEIHSKDDPESWAALIHLCKVLTETPTDQLQAALEPILDVDGVLRFLAIDNALVNDDGFWTRASDYSIYTDGKGRFHLTPHDANEGFRPIEAFGWRSANYDSAPPDTVRLDPLVAAGDEDKPLISRLLAVPALRQRYLAYVRDIAQHWLTWDRLGPIVRNHQAVIADDIKLDTRKLYSTEAFAREVTVDTAESTNGGPTSPPTMSLKTFVEQRRAYLLQATTRQP